MTTRFTTTTDGIKPPQSFKTPGITSGYGSLSATDFTVPPCGIDDVDRALFNLFNKELPLYVGAQGEEIKKVPIIFATGEKWALLKKTKPIRDRNNTLILPLITIVRTMIKQDAGWDINGRGINQQTGELTVQRRLDVADRAYQAKVNKYRLEHQQNIAASALIDPDPGDALTVRNIGGLAGDPVVAAGGLLKSDRTDNIYETIVIPSPQFFTAVYDVTIWTQYIQHMNQIMEQFLASFLPQGNAWRLETSKGYWFIATVDNNTYTADNNFEDMATEERLVKTKFVINVPAYNLATSVPGAPIPIKRYVSAPIVAFGVGAGDSELMTTNTVEDPNLGADDPTLPLAGARVRSVDQRADGSTLLYAGDGANNRADPAMTTTPRGSEPARYVIVEGIDRSGKKVTKYVRETMNKAGERTMSPGVGLSGLTITVV